MFKKVPDCFPVLIFEELSMDQSPVSHLESWRQLPPSPPCELVPRISDPQGCVPRCPSSHLCRFSSGLRPYHSFMGHIFLFFNLSFLYFSIYLGCAGSLLWHTVFVATCEILVPQAGSEPGPPASGAWILIHLTTGEALDTHFSKFKISWLFFQMFSSVRI